MKRAAQRWMVVQIAGLCLAAAATVASAAEVVVTDTDRTYKNFTKECATVRQGEVRVELRGLMEQDDTHTTLNLLGFPIKRVADLSGGIIDLVASYGFTKNGEVGLIIPTYIQSLTLLTGGPKVNNSDIGDVELYGKFLRSVAEHWNVGAGLELTMPNGPVNKGFGTGQLGVNPVISTRFQQGRFGIGGNIGYFLYNGNVPDVFNYGFEGFMRVGDNFTVRTELVGRVFNTGGTRYDDLTILPGIDFKWSDMLTIRPTGLAGLTTASLDWGIGVGAALAF